MTVSDAITPELVADLGQRLRDFYAALSDEEKVLFEEFCRISAHHGEVTGFMSADVTTFDPGRHFAGVLMQQGRVQLDADNSEQAGILRHRAELALPLLGTWLKK